MTHTGKRPRSRFAEWIPVASTVAVDLSGFAFSFAIATLLMVLLRRERMNGDLTYWWSTTGQPQTFLFLVFAFLAVARMASKGHYTARLPFWDELLSIWQVLLLSVVLFGTTFVAAGWTVSRFLWPVSWGVAGLLLPSGRAAARRLLDRRGLWQRPTVVIGNGNRPFEVARALESDRSLGNQVVAILVPDFDRADVSREEDIHDRDVHSIHPDSIAEWLEGHGFPDIVVALDPGSTGSQDWVEALTLYPSGVRVVPAMGGLPLLGLGASLVFRHDILLLQIRNRLDRGAGAWFKRGFDALAAAVGLALLWPLLLWVGWKIRRNGGPGPVLFGHHRVGRDGRTFRCWKFRTMVRDSERVLQELLDADPIARTEWERDFKLKHDPRVTPFGAFLRRTSLDELPQLWNVLKGEMSLVGPRPIVPAELERYGSRADFYRSVRPGITGLWQVSGRSELSYPERVALDAWYVKNWRFWYDLAILAQTVTAVFRTREAR